MGSIPSSLPPQKSSQEDLPIKKKQNVDSRALKKVISDKQQGRSFHVAGSLVASSQEEYKHSIGDNPKTAQLFERTRQAMKNARSQAIEDTEF